MISTVKYIAFIFAILQSFAISAFAQSNIQEDAKFALIEARNLNETAVLEGTQWIIAKEYLSRAEKSMSRGKYQNALNMANKAIHFLVLGLEQKEEQLHENQE